jgi:hypothetical protein
MDDRALLAIMAAIITSREEIISINERRIVVQAAVETAADILSKVDSGVGARERF